MLCGIAESKGFSGRLRCSRHIDDGVLNAVFAIDVTVGLKTRAQRRAAPVAAAIPGLRRVLNEVPVVRL